MGGNIRAMKRAVWIQIVKGRMLFKRAKGKIIFFTTELISLRQALRNYIKRYINFIRVTICIMLSVKLHFFISYNFITTILLVCKIIFESACLFPVQSLQ